MSSRPEVSIVRRNINRRNKNGLFSSTVSQTKKSPCPVRRGSDNQRRLEGALYARVSHRCREVARGRKSCRSVASSSSGCRFRELDRQSIREGEGEAR